MEEKTSTEIKKSGQIDILALLSYVGILFILPLMVRKEDQFVQFHAKQGLVLFLAELAVSIWQAVPVIGWTTAPLLALVCFIFSIIGIVNVINGKKQELPLIGQYADKFKI